MAKPKEMNVVNKGRKNFTMISNTAIDSEISLPALGLYIKMLRKPEKWSFYINGLAKESKISPNYLRKLLKELHDAKWVINHGQIIKAGGNFGGNKYTVNFNRGK